VGDAFPPLRDFRPASFGNFNVVADLPRLLESLPLACAMQQHTKKRAGALSAVLAAALTGCGHGSGAGARPPAVTSRAWSWAAAAPGVNIYVADQGTPRDSGVRSVWVDRQYFNNLAGVNADVIELRHFDCRHDTGRWRTVRGAAAPDPTPGRVLTPSEQLLRTVCQRGPAQ
jgi:hypothetical protein